MREEVEVLSITEELVRGYHRAVDSLAREGRYLARTEAPPLAEAQAFVRENLSRGNAHYVAVHGREVVGWCDIVPSRREAFAHCGTLGMGLTQDYRSQGIGTRLLRAAVEHAREQGLERVELEVFSSNREAIGLYEKEGFQSEGRKVRAAKLGGAYLDVILMALFLAEHSLG